ncbi:hypothetical protein F4818DRAFT_187897 [Hypoxylon cercidicola]|nr:hypothetical protein F4818DRAFT_187897 [Hypoxylon cercidicola]
MAVSYLTISVFVVLCAYLASRFKRRHTADGIGYIQEHRAIANFGILGRSNVRGRLRARAIPNERLIIAFGIDSSFTTEDPTVHYEFLRRANINISKMEPEHCAEFFNAAKLALDRTVAHLGPSAQHALPLARVVRSVVFITTLHKFFNVNPLSVDIETAIQATEVINRLWVQSKLPEQAGEDADRRLLQHALERLLPEWFPCKPRDHPLNIIIPAYETMWRVVLLTFVVAGFRSQDNTEPWQFRDVVQTLPRCLGGEDKFSERVALDFAREGLRLYPPTRRIYRAVPRPRGHVEIKYAEVEKCHRDKNIWGPDVLQFRPSRWHAVSADMRSAYMPFGDGRHICPTASRFGYRAIILFVAALARRLGTRESGVSVDFGKQNAELQSHLDAPLPYGRQETEDWLLMTEHGSGSKK